MPPHQTTRPVDLLRTRWTGEPIAGLNAGISEEALRRFESKNNVSVPIDFAQYLTTFNGFSPSMEPDGWDDVDVEGFRFYSLEALSELDTHSGYFEFCTWELGLLTYAISFRGDRTNGAVVMVGKPNIHAVADSFASFVEMYVQNESSLYKWGPIVSANGDA